MQHSDKAKSDCKKVKNINGTTGLSIFDLIAKNNNVNEVCSLEDFEEKTTLQNSNDVCL